MRTIDEEIDQIEFEVLQEYIESGRTKEMPEEILRYLELMEVVRGLHLRQKSRAFIVKLLKSDAYGLSDYSARKVYADAINFFYLNNDIRKEAFRNVYAEKIEKAAAVVLETAKSSKDLEVYVKMLKESAQLRGLYEPDAAELPNSLFEKPVKIYELDPGSIGLPSVDRRDLADMIDKLPIGELDKDRLKRDARVESPVLFLEDDAQKKD